MRFVAVSSIRLHTHDDSTVAFVIIYADLHKKRHDNGVRKQASDCDESLIVPDETDAIAAINIVTRLSRLHCRPRILVSSIKYSAETREFRVFSG